MSINVGRAVAYLTLDLSQFSSGISEALGSLRDIESTASSVSSKIKNFGSALSTAGSTLTKTVTLPLTGLGTAMVTASSSIESETKKITAYFGDVGEAATRNEKLFKDVYATGVTSSMESVSAAIISVRENLGELGDAELTSIAEQAIYLDETFGVDMNESLRGVNSLMKNFGMSATEAMDYLVKGTQEGLDKTHELGDNLAEYGQLWSQAGFSASEMFAILDNGLKSGAYNLDKVNDFVKEFTISLSDGRIERNLESFSANTRILFEEYKQGKATAKDVFYSIINDLETTMTKQEALTVASNTWSALGEDNALAVISALNDVNDTFVDVTGTAEEFADTMGSGTAGSLAMLRNNVTLLAATFGEKLQPLIDNLITLTSNLITALQGMDAETVSMITTIGLVVAAIGPVISIVGKVISVVGTVLSVGGEVIAGIKALGTLISGVLIPAITAISAPVWIVIGVITALIAIGVALYKNWDELAAWAKKAWSAITEAVGNAVGAISEFFSELGQAIADTVAAIGDWLSNLWDSIVSFFSNLLSNVTDWLSSIWEKITSFIDTLASIAERIAEFFGNILSAVGEFFSELFSNVKEALGNIIQSIVEFGSNIISKAVEIGKNFVSSFAQTFANLVSSVTSFINDFITMITRWGQDLWNKAAEIGRGFVNAIINNVQKVGRFFGEIFDDIISTIKNLLPKMIEAGKDIITNLWEGMKSVFTSVASWITDAFSKLFKPISDSFSKLFSPVKNLFDNIGSFFSGSHANGLDYVPYNGYIAQLHEGERVLTKQENEEYNNGNDSRGGGDTFNFYNTKPDPYEYARQMKRTKKELEDD